eukprot:scaffold1239_cov175-Pinguiococcus_pyrenoidosus.AAC.54
MCVLESRFYSLCVVWRPSSVRKTLLRMRSVASSSRCAVPTSCTTGRASLSRKPRPTLALARIVSDQACRNRGKQHGCRHSPKN